MSAKNRSRGNYDNQNDTNQKAVNQNGPTGQAEAGGRTIRTLIAVPCMEMVHTDFMQAFVMLKRVGDTRFGITKCSMLHDARNTFASKAIQGGYDRVLWLDSDMVFKPDLMERLSADMDEGREFVSALAFKRVAPIDPVIYGSLTELEDAPGLYRADALADYPEDQLFRIEGSGFGAVMVSTDLIKRIWDRYGPPFNYVANLGEDLSFCWKARQIGAELWCDSRVKAGHIGSMVFDEEIYREQRKQREGR